MEWDATEAACAVVNGISEIKGWAGHGQQYTMLHFIEVFKGSGLVPTYSVGALAVTKGLRRMTRVLADWV